MKINTIKNFVHQEKKFQLPIKILYCNDEITLNSLQNNLCIITYIKRLIFINIIETLSFRGPDTNTLVTEHVSAKPCFLSLQVKSSILLYAHFLILYNMPLDYKNYIE